MIRALLCGLAIATFSVGGAGCFFGGQDSETAGVNDGAEPPSDPDTAPGANEQCAQASDCELAASTCCECPSFAVPSGQGFDGGCQDVQCEPSGLCPAVEASCDSGQCVMICSPIITNQICAFGFERDSAGCLSNVCAAPLGGAPVSCALDQECVQIPADCCGCSQGGLDQAVPAGTEDAELDSLACPANPACPNIDVCDPAQVPRCIAGTCVLAEEQPAPLEGEETLCGTPELPLCGAGANCVLNDLSANNASDFGVGVCKPE